MLLIKPKDGKLLHFCDFTRVELILAVDVNHNVVSVWYKFWHLFRSKLARLEGFRDGLTFHKSNASYNQAACLLYHFHSTLNSFLGFWHFD
ncbi:hypothetical protein AGR13a_Lc30045 [Agrobacterium genomosp. 13 str. CFBP 6927]|uniref:Transposase n=1 Tax=Agrobacterium genomosp. 13 str. CFBP 6927 TaxID=1183428 RepID=A0ABM9VLQ8_9HYPH|nr:hypothetical protein AGR13a_Lc30045 [Agrobacterium genomosp. 13 str. CFBP 6927]